MAITVIKIGSHLDNDIRLAHEGISEFHARISINESSEVYITNVDATDGTFVNDSAISGLRRLSQGDVVKFSNVKFDWETELADHLKGAIIDPLVIAATEKEKENTQKEEEFEYVRPKSKELLDELETDFIDEEDRSGPEGAAGLIHQIQYPKDRAKQHRMWILVLSIIMIASLALPYLPWYSEIKIGGDQSKDFETLSSIDLFLELISMEAPDSMVLTTRYLLYIMGIPIIAASWFVLFLVGVKAIKPQTSAIVKGFSLTIIVTMSILLISQGIWYLSLMSDANNVTGVGGAKLALYLGYEYHGVGFWICFISAALIYRSAGRKLWQKEYSRKWATLSFSFWMPIVMLLMFSTSYLGFMVQEVDMGKMWSDFNASGAINPVRESKVFTTQQSGALIMSGAYYSKSIELGIDQEKMGKFIADRIEKQSFASTIILFSFTLYFICVLMLMFSKRLLSDKTLVLAFISLGLLFLSYLSLNYWIGIQSEVGRSQFVTLSVGWGLYIAALASVVMIVELFIERNKKLTPKNEVLL